MFPKPFIHDFNKTLQDLEDLILQSNSRSCCCFRFLDTHSVWHWEPSLVSQLLCVPKRDFLCWTITSVHTKGLKDLQVELIFFTKTRLQHASRELNVIWTEKHHWMSSLASMPLQSSCKNVYIERAWRNILFTLLSWAIESLQMTKVIIKTAHSEL